jgi:DNA-binding transcriptional ArsR family regulator
MPVKLKCEATVIIQKNGEWKILLTIPEAVNQMLDERIQAILDELRGHPEGFSFNQLCVRLREKMARQTLNMKLSWLLQCGLVQRTPEKPRKGQMVIYKLSHRDDIQII